MRTITNQQKANIKMFTGSKFLAMSDDLYRETLLCRYGVDSCKSLTYEQAREFITSLKNTAEKSGLWTTGKKSFNNRKYDNLGKREGFASPAQLRKIDAMWKEKSYQKTDADKEEALNTFLLNRFGVSNIKWIETSVVQKVIKTIDSMKKPEQK